MMAGAKKNGFPGGLEDGFRLIQALDSGGLHTV